MNRRMLAVVCCVPARGPALAGAPQPSNAVSPAEMRAIVATASSPSPAWNGPRTGPAGITGKSIVVIAEDLRNGGILGVAVLKDFPIAAR